MKSQWTNLGLVEHWTLLPGEAVLLSNKTGPTRLGFAVLLSIPKPDGRQRPLGIHRCGVQQSVSATHD